MSKILGRDDIDGYDENEPIRVDAFGGIVLAQPLTGNERDKYEASFWRGPNGKRLKEPDLRGSRAKIVAMGMVDESGNRLYDWRDQRDLRILGEKPAHDLDKVAEAIRTASGMDDEYAEEAAEDFDEGDADGEGSSFD